MPARTFAAVLAQRSCSWRREPQAPLKYVAAPPPPPIPPTCSGIMQLGWTALSARFTSEEGVGDSKDSFA